ncbi:hypothetical protein QBC43DRAFT_300968 [Cladorrhinum sp. PSN259]|nr:hypothetical protein QBC43DRAFT_300968 [Cladorrhinum sp. PSN259]
MKAPVWIGFTTVVLSSIPPFISNTFYLLSVSELQTPNNKAQENLTRFSVWILVIGLLDVVMGAFLISRRSTTLLPNAVAFAVATSGIVVGSFGLLRCYDNSAGYKVNNKPTFLLQIFRDCLHWVYSIILSRRRPLRLWHNYQPVISRPRRHSRKPSSSEIEFDDTEEGGGGPLSCLAKEHRRKAKARGSPSPPRGPRFNPVVYYWADPRDRLLRMASANEAKPVIAADFILECVAAVAAYKLKRLPQWALYLGLVPPCTLALCIATTATVIRFRIPPTRTVMRYYRTVNLGQLLSFVWAFVIATSCTVNILVTAFSVRAAVLSFEVVADSAKNDLGRPSVIYVLLTARTCIFCIMVFAVPVLCARDK